MSMRVLRKEFKNTEDGALYLHKMWEIDWDTAIDLAIALLELDPEKRVMFFYEF